MKSANSFLRKDSFDSTKHHAITSKIDKDLTPEAWARFAKRAHIPDGMDPIVALENLHLLENGVMTHAGAWLLAEDITRYTLTAGVTCAVLRGVRPIRISSTSRTSQAIYAPSTTTV